MEVVNGRNGLTGECVKQSDRIGAHIKERGSLVAHFVVDLTVLEMRKKPVHVPRMEDGVTGVNGLVVAVELVEVKKEQGVVITHYLVREELNVKVQMRKRDGAQCDGSCYEVRNCTVHCEWGEWFEFSACDNETAKQFFIRHEAVTAKNGGDPCDCEDPDKCDAKIEPCDSQKCRPCDGEGCTVVDGNFGDWSEWSCCDSESKTRTRQRGCDNPPPQNGGADCPVEGKTETEGCAVTIIN